MTYNVFMGMLNPTHSLTPVVTTICITLSSNKIQNGYILYRLTQVHVEKWPLKKNCK